MIKIIDLFVREPDMSAEAFESYLTGAQNFGNIKAFGSRAAGIIPCDVE